MANANESEQGTEPVSSDRKYDVLAREADGYYRMIVTISTAFLGGSILFLERLAKQPECWTLPLLASGWVSFLVAIHSVASVRRQNLEALRLALEGKYDQARSIDERTRTASTLALWAMLVGMFLMAVYGFSNLVVELQTGPLDVG